MMRRQSFAPNQKLRYVRQRWESVDHGVEKGGGKPQQAHAVRRYRGDDLQGTRNSLGKEHQAATVNQCGPNLEGRCIERNRRQVEDGLVRVEVNVIGTVEQTNDPAVANLDPPRHSG